MSELYREGYTQNRELSWLRFNDRVLSEAMDETVPLLERLKFIAIFTSNLDEFFMIRAGSLFDLMQEEPDIVDNKSGMTPGEQLGAIFDAVRPLYQKKEALFHEVERLLRYHDICDLGYRELEKNERACVKQYYEAAVAPVLSPQIVDVQHPFPHLANKVIHVGVMLRHKNREVFGVLPLPAALPDVFYLPGSETRYIRMENIVLEYAKKLFHPYEVLEKTILCVTRNADVNPDDETFADETDFRQRMKKVLNRRNRLAPVRLELSNAVSPTFLAYLKGRLGLDDNQIYITDAPLRMEYVYGLIARAGKGRQGPQLLYAPFLPVWPAAVSRGESLIHQVERRDILLSFPFESMDPFLALLREAGRDPAVISIKITIYRLARKAKLVEYLCAAAENGKSVTVRKGRGRAHPHQDQLPDGRGHHRQALGGVPRGRAGAHDRARHLLPAARRPRQDGEHPHLEHRGPVSGAYPGLLLRRRRGDEDVHLLGRLHDAQYGAARGGGLPDL